MLLENLQKLKVELIERKKENEQILQQVRQVQVLLCQDKLRYTDNISSDRGGLQSCISTEPDWIRDKMLYPQD